jgi:hypothetical protein
MQGKKLVASLVFFSALTFGSVAGAQDAAVEAPADAAVVAADAGTAPVLDAGPSADIGDRAEDLEGSVAEYREAPVETKHLALAGMLASLFWLVFALLKSSKLFPADSKWIPVAAIAVSMIAAATDRFALGDTWMQAIIVGGGASFSVLIQATIRAFTK